MLKKRPIPVGTLFMGLVVALAAVGIGYGLWSQTLFIQGSVSAGDLNAEFVDAFTDDDGSVNNEAKDAGDSGPDPSAAGPNPARIADDLALCTAALASEEADLDPEVGIQTALLNISQGYPSYWCTAWFDLSNTGSVPVIVQGVQIPLLGSTVSVGRCEDGAFTPVDLDGDGAADIEVCTIGLPAEGNARIDPGVDVPFQLGLATHLLQVDANQGRSFEYMVHVLLQQWTAEPPPAPTVEPTEVPTEVPTEEPTEVPTEEPTVAP